MAINKIPPRDLRMEADEAEQRKHIPGAERPQEISIHGPLFGKTTRPAQDGADNQAAYGKTFSDLR